MRGQAIELNEVREQAVRAELNLPVAEEKYRVTLKFYEGHYGKRNTGIGGAGSRLFDVYCNGVSLMCNFDIFK